MILKKKIGKIHLWLGLASGLIVFVVAITGCLFVFQKEISDIYYHDTFCVTPPKEAKALSVTKLKEIADKVLVNPTTYITTYKDKNRAWEFMVYKAGDEKAWTWFGSIDTYKTAFINPYTGTVTGIIDYETNFFAIVKML